MHTLYGDGIHCDSPAIQEMLDSGISCVYLPVPQDCYLIDRPLIIHSHQELRLDSYTVIKLAPGSNCFMLTNENQDTHDEHITIRGGIWDMQNLKQQGNPFHDGSYKASSIGCQYFHHSDCYDKEYLGVAMRFNHIDHFVIEDVTVRNPVTFGIELGNLNQFTVRDITLDYTTANPAFVNMDGVHIDGGCRFGYIANLKGTAHDDMLALNADDLLSGPISDITVDGVYCHGCFSAVRILSCVSPVKNISISNVFGTVYHNAVTISRYYLTPPEAEGLVDHVSLKNICLSFTDKKAIAHTYDDRFCLINVVGDDRLTTPLDIRVKNLYIEGIHREEYNRELATIKVWGRTAVDNLTVVNSSTENHVGKPMPFLANYGTIGKLNLLNVDPGEDPLVENHGEIGRIREEG